MKASAQTTGPDVCLPSARRPSTVALLPLALLHAVLAGGVALAARCRRARSRVSGYYFPERAAERAVHLYGVLTSRRRRVPRLLRAAARTRARQHRRAAADSASAPARPSCCRGRSRRSCLVCGSAGGQLIGCRRQSARTAGVDVAGCCPAVYCAECWEDLGRLCAVCQCPSSNSTSSQLHHVEAAVDLLDTDNDTLLTHYAAAD